MARIISETERQKIDKAKRGRFLRPSTLIGWQATREGLLLIYRDYSREVLPMSERDAMDNAFFLEMQAGQEIVCLTFD